MPRPPKAKKPATRGLTRLGEAGRSDRDILHWIPHQPEDFGDNTSSGSRAGRRDDRRRDSENPKTKIPMARSPEAKGGSRMPVRDELPDDPKARKRNPKLRGA